MKLSGPSMGYGFFETRFKLLILGDFHTPMETTDLQNSIFDFLSTSSRKHSLDIYLEDVPFIGKTTEMETLYRQQKELTCNEDVCHPLKIEQIDVNGTKKEKVSTLRGLVEYLFTCGRDDRICPLSKTNVHRMDIRAQVLIKKANGEVVQVVDDRGFLLTPGNFTREMTKFKEITQPQVIALHTGVSYPLIKSACSILNALPAPVFQTLFRWWLDKIQNTYAPWVLDPSFVFSREYHRSWAHQTDETSRRALLHLITTNAIMDLCCIAKMLANNVMEHGKCSVVYSGCAHAECVADFFKSYGKHEEALENKNKLQPVTKFVTFSENLRRAFL